MSDKRSYRNFPGKLTLPSATELICKAGKPIKVQCSSLSAQNVPLSTVCVQNFFLFGKEHSLLWCDSVSSFISYNFPSNTQGTSSPRRFLPCGKCTTGHSAVQIIGDSSFSLPRPAYGYIWQASSKICLESFHF